MPHQFLEWHNCGLVIGQNENCIPHGLPGRGNTLCLSQAEIKEGLLHQCGTSGCFVRFRGEGLYHFLATRTAGCLHLSCTGGNTVIGRQWSSNLDRFSDLASSYVAASPNSFTPSMQNKTKLNLSTQTNKAISKYTANFSSRQQSISPRPPPPPVFIHV